MGARRAGVAELITWQLPAAQRRGEIHREVEFQNASYRAPNFAHIPYSCTNT